jgi:hypothetical protein
LDWNIGQARDSVFVSAGAGKLAAMRDKCFACLGMFDCSCMTVRRLTAPIKVVRVCLALEDWNETGFGLCARAISGV